MIIGASVVDILCSIPLLIVIYVELVLVLIPSMRSDDRLDMDTKLRKKYYLDGWVRGLDMAACAAFLIGLALHLSSDDFRQAYYYGFHAMQLVAALWLCRWVYRSKNINFVVK